VSRASDPRTCRLLLERFGSAEQIFKATGDEIAAAGIGRKIPGSIASFRDFAPLEKELCELPRLGARLVRWTDEDYPPNLKQIADPPPTWSRAVCLGLARLRV
jgi:DNA processing protein